MIETRLVETSVHGRFLLRKGAEERLIVGFHGYGENADKHLGELLRIPGIDAWSVAAVQALHPFYNVKTQEVIASWMTKLDRDHAIADNVAYVRRVVDSLWRRRPRRRAAFSPPRPAGPQGGQQRLVFAGFSQGAAMAYRAAAAIPCDGLIILAGDVPPDANLHNTKILLGRGTRDDWYTAEKLEKDLSILGDVTTCVFDGGHEWTDEFREAAGAFLRLLEHPRQ